ncbi:MAG: efflux RND transporter permease subunit [Planctomycetota bacterium]
MKIVNFSIHRPVTITMLMVSMLVFGFIALDKLAINLLPDISYPSLTIRTEYRGAAPNEVETLISKPIEDAVGVIPGVMRVSSISRPNVSDVTIEFAWQTNMDFASLDVREKLELVYLPDDADRPVLLRFDPALDPIMRIGLYGDEDLVTLRLIAEDDIKPILDGLSSEDKSGQRGGVAAVKISGGLEEEVHVEINEGKLAALGIPISQVVARLAQENVNLTGGNLKDGEAEYIVRTLNEFKRVDEINDVVLAIREGREIRFSDVATARKGHKDIEVATRINGKETVEIAVFKEGDANTVSVARLVKEKLKEIRRDLQRVSASLHLDVVSDQSRFIEDAVREVQSAAIVGGLLAIGILYLFLRDLKSTIIISFSIPLSVVTTFFCMFLSNITLNIMSLGGLALGVGMLVDNAIVVLESIDRYRSMGKSAEEAATQGTSEVGMAVSASTLTTVCVFVPIVFVHGIAGQLFTDQALTVTYSLSISLLVALTFIPMLSSLEIKRTIEAPKVVTFPRTAVLLLLMSVAGLVIWFGGKPTAEQVSTTRLAGAISAAVVLLLLAGLICAGWAALKEVLRLVGQSLRSRAARLFILSVLLALLTVGLFYLKNHAELIDHVFPPEKKTPISSPRWGGGMAAPTPKTLPELFIGFSRRTVEVLSTQALLVSSAFWVWLIAYSGAAIFFAFLARNTFRAVGAVLSLVLFPVVFAFERSYGLLAFCYPFVIEFAVKHKVTILALALLLFWVSWALLGGVGAELIPEMSQGELIVTMEMPVGTPIEQTEQVVAKMEDMIRRSDLAKTVYSMVGFTGQTGGKAGERLQHIAQINILLPDGAGRDVEETLMARLRPEFDGIPGLEYKFSRPTYFSFKTPIEIEISGYNLSTLDSLARQVADTISDLPQITDVKSSSEGGNPEIHVVFDRQKVAMHGLDIGTIAAAIRNNVDGDIASEFSQRDKKVDIRVRARRADIEGIDKIRRLTVNPQGGARIPLSLVATVETRQGPAEIRRVGNERVVIVSANLRGLDLSSAVSAIEQRVARIPCGGDFNIEVVGQSQEMTSAFASMRFAALLATFLVYLVMASQFESLLHPFVIMFAIPFGLIGVVFALVLAGQNISVVVLIGVVLLAGIAVNNAIVLVDCINARRGEGMSRREAIAEAGKLRLRPILMTTTTTILGLLPMAVPSMMPAFLGAGQGAEMRQPMGIAVIGGMVSSTLLTLVFVPTLYEVFESIKERTLRLIGKNGDRSDVRSVPVFPVEKAE